MNLYCSYTAVKRNRLFSCLLFVLVLLVVSSCTEKAPQTRGTENAHADSIKRAVVRYVFGIETPIPVHCGQFDAYFKGEVNETTLTARPFLRDFAEELKGSYGMRSQEEYQGDNVRIVVLLFGEAVVDTVCMGEFFGVSLNGEVVRDNPQLFQLVYEYTGDPKLVSEQ